MKHLARINPLLAAAFPVTFLYANNIDEVRVATFGSVLLFVLAGTAIFMLIARILLRSDIKAGLVVTVCVLLFFLGGHIYELIVNKSIAGFVIGRYRYLLLAMILVVLVTLWVAFRRERFAFNLTPYITGGLVVLALANVFTIGLYQIQSFNPAEPQVVRADGSITPKLSRDQMPDIYYIILDAYAREDVLQDVFGFDNSGFLGYLRRNDFYVADQSQTNYMLTRFSLSSSLNMDYLDNITNGIDVDFQDKSIFRPLIQNSSVVAFAKSIGYRFVFLNSPWSHTQVDRRADVELSRRGYPMGTFGRLILRPIWGSDFGSFFSRRTVLRGFVDSLEYSFSRALFSDNIEHLKEIPDISDPTFTFAHLFPPHHPFIFDRNGNSPKGAYSPVKSALKERYIDQLIWVNKSVEKAVEQILAKDKNNSVIVIQGDHGTNIANLRKNGEPDESVLWELGSILNAYHFPDVCQPNSLYHSITPVNTFRAIFDDCLGTEFGQLEDTTFWWDADRPADLRPIDDVLRDATGS